MVERGNSNAPYSGVEENKSDTNGGLEGFGAPGKKRALWDPGNFVKVGIGSLMPPWSSEWMDPKSCSN